MAKQLVIVESPAKAKTINRYLGKDYLVKASIGHIRDLPKKKLGVDIDHDFQPDYVIIPERMKIVTDLQGLAREVESVLLAADPDREGEAICWHLSEILERSNKKIFRVLMHEITKNAVKEAFQNLVHLDKDKINAQQTRRILDRLVGYLISPLLWKKVGRGLSAGRVQSIALRLICEREKEIKDFVPEEYWTITAHLEASNPPSFKASLAKIDGKKAKVKNEKSAVAIVSGLWKIPFVLQRIEVKKKKKNPSPPYITSTLQQDGFRLLRFPVKRTMFVAQKLYEGLEIGEKGLVGLVTYMRTDSVRVSDGTIASARNFIHSHFPPEYLPKKARIYKNKRQAQDAHEAIRPTSFDLPPETVKPYLKSEEYNLYKLIWNRFLASQMSSALVEETVFEIEASRYQFIAKGEVLEFDGYLILYPQLKKEEDILPKAQEGEELTVLDIDSKQNFTQPPPRYTEGSLVKELEAKGIGRPSTYAPIIATLQDRVYVFKENGRFIPSDLGLFVTDYLIKNFPDLMDFEFTARLEAELDLISEGKQEWLDYLRSYYVLLEKDLREAMKEEGIKKKGIPVEDVCPECGRQLVIKEGKYGRFKACSGFPECNFKESLVKKEAKPLEEACPECGSQLVMRRGKYGTFVACSNYPECTYVKKEKKDTGISCPFNCGGTLVRRKTRRGKIFYGCSTFPKCQFATWDEPVPIPCPECGRPFVLKKDLLRGKPYLYCSDEKCSHKEDIQERQG
ncbi:MAG: type I DNA topoisomerase [Candidatus Aminicenantes bacterium]|nr:type I DNA topoisomerase [Candidatus Aminicenantes bacterium]MDH5743053.1 type I DNA topoisomerase [Candidatus Aminicenantes bacterium]